MKLRIIAAIVGGTVALIIGLNGGGFLATSLSGIVSGFVVGLVFGGDSKKDV